MGFGRETVSEVKEAVSVEMARYNLVDGVIVKVHASVCFRYLGVEVLVDGLDIFVQSRGQLLLGPFELTQRARLA